MTGKHTDSPSPGINPKDILYVIFRHKWKIAFIAALGIIAAITLPRIRLVPYQSEARLYVRFVMESRSPTSEAANDMNRPDLQGVNIINNEVETITSSDLAQKVAEILGPERILSKSKGETNVARAAAVILKNLSVEVPRNTSVIKLLFMHEDPGVAQQVLAQLIDLYLKKHAENHAVGALAEFLTPETDQLHSRLVQLQDDLRKVKEKAGIISIDESLKTS